MNLRDPVLYRIKHAEHHRTGDKWCLYPMYTYAHPIEDAHRARHAFAVHARVRGPAAASTTGCSSASPRPGCCERPLPQQIEFARLNLTYVVL